LHLFHKDNIAYKSKLFKYDIIIPVTLIYLFNAVYLQLKGSIFYISFWNVKLCRNFCDLEWFRLDGKL